MIRSPEYNSFERPSFERMWGNFEWAKEPLPELRKSTPEQIQNTERVNRFANELFQSHMKIEIVSRDEVKQYFDTHLDTIWRTGEISFNQEKKVQEKPKEIITQTPPEKLSKLEKQVNNPNTLWEKENLTTYAELSDLAYVDFCWG